MTLGLAITSTTSKMILYAIFQLVYKINALFFHIMGKILSKYSNFKPYKKILDNKQSFLLISQYAMHNLTTWENNYQTLELKNPNSSKN